MFSSSITYFNIENLTKEIICFVATFIFSSASLLAGKEGVPVSDLEILLSQVEHVRDAAVVYVNVEHV